MPYFLKKPFWFFITPILVGLIFCLVVLGNIFEVKAELATTTVTVVSVCGNDVREANEVCDRTDLAGKTCQDFG